MLDSRLGICSCCCGLHLSVLNNLNKWQHLCNWNKLSLQSSRIYDISLTLISTQGLAKFRLLRIISEVLESTGSSQKSDSHFWRFGDADPWRWVEVGAQCNWWRHHYISFSSRDGCMHCLQGWEGILSMSFFPMSFFSCWVLKFGGTFYLLMQEMSSLKQMLWCSDITKGGHSCTPSL